MSKHCYPIKSTLDMHVVDCRQVHGIYNKINGTVRKCARFISPDEQTPVKPSWPPACEEHLHNTGQVGSVSQALKPKGQSEIGKRDVMEHQPGPTGNMGS